MQTVRHNGSLMAMTDAAMAELGWTNGQAITGEQVYQGIAANARTLCRDIERRGLDIDTSELAAKCGHTRSN